MMDSLWVLAVTAIVVAGLILKLFFSFHLVGRRWRSVRDWCHEYSSYRVPELNEATLQENHLYRKVCSYLNSLPSLEDSDYANLVSGQRGDDVALRLDPGQLVKDSFLGAEVSWRREEMSVAGMIRCESLVLRLKKKDKDRVLRPYLCHVGAAAADVEAKKGKEIRIFAVVGAAGGRRWRGVPFKHPVKCEMFAMNDGVKTKLKADLDTFFKSKQYYNRVGRVWKRTYLLHGPAGTGKSSFVAAMARLLGYDIYDLDLGQLAGEADLKSLLLRTGPRSIVLIEDLDRHLGRSGQTVDVSGLLAFIDGVWSGCAEGQVVVFTAANRDAIDPVVLRPGRVDVHVHFPLCDYPAFRALAGSYLGLKEHKLFGHVEEVLRRNGPKLSPAEMGEIMMVNRASPSRALKTVISALEERRGGGSGGGGGGGGRGLEEDPTVDVADQWDGKRSGRDLTKLYRFFRRGNRKSDSTECDKECS